MKKAKKLLFAFLLSFFFFNVPLFSVSASAPVLWYGQKVNVKRAMIGGDFYHVCNSSHWNHPNGPYTNSHNRIVLNVYVPHSVGNIDLIFYGDFDYGQLRERMGVTVNGQTRYGGETGDWGGWHEFVVGPFNFNRGENRIVLKGEHWHDWQTCPSSHASGSIHFRSTGWVMFKGSAPVFAPTVDIKANGSDGPISLSYNSSVTLSWTSSNATSCTAYNGWSGSKAISGSETVGNLTSSRTYKITCTGSGGTASDSVTVNVNIGPPTVVTQPAIVITY